MFGAIAGACTEHKKPTWRVAVAAQKLAESVCADGYSGVHVCLEKTEAGHSILITVDDSRNNVGLKLPPTFKGYPVSLKRAVPLNPGAMPHFTL